MSAKYKLIANELRSQILSAKSITPHKLPTEQELCRHYQVSRQTIRQALLTLENERLITRRQGSGAYTIPLSEHLKEKKIVLLLSNETEYTYPSFVSDLHSVLKQQGFFLTTLTTQNDINIERTLLTQLLDETIHVLIVEGIRSAFPNPNIDLYEKLQLSGSKLVFISHSYPEIANALFIKPAEQQGGAILGDYLISNHLIKPAAILPDFAQNAKERYFGLQTAYRDQLLSLPSSAVFWYTEKDLQLLRQRQDTGFLLPFIRTYAQECDSIFCYSDEIAYWLIKELKYAGYSIPGQLAVVSFDNSYLSTLSTPAISSLGLPFHEPGLSLGELIVDLLHDKKTESKTLPWKLFSRSSVASLPINYF